MAMFGLFGNKKKTSSSVAKDRLKLVLIHDRAGTSSNNEMIEMMKRDILKVISEYIEIDESEFELDIKTAKGGKDRVFVSAGWGRHGSCCGSRCCRKHQEQTRKHRG